MKPSNLKSREKWRARKMMVQRQSLVQQSTTSGFNHGPFSDHNAPKKLLKESK
jgi:hypothetical protein